VRVLTYHRAKGLEWPVVILLDLQDGAKRSPFGAYSESPATGLDPWNPLAGRWIRFWPWPYGDQEKDVHLDVTASASPQAQARTEAELAELVRLLYVGITRARDYLVFATRPSASSAWIDILTQADGMPVLTLPVTDGEAQVNVAGEAFTMVVQSASPPPAAAAQDEAPDVAWYVGVCLAGLLGARASEDARCRRSFQRTRHPRRARASARCATHSPTCFSPARARS
jgi:ATP-dependent helicase/nuclease subunit A